MKEVQEFCGKYDAVVGPSSQRRRRHRLVTMQEWEKDPFEPMPTWDVAMVEITMPEDRFRALMEHDHWLARAGLQHNNHFQNNVMRVSNMIVDHERECRLRAEHPALQKAWEQYQIMLRMVDTGG